MTASQRRTVTLVVAGVGVAFLLVWAANATPGVIVAEQRSGPGTTQVDEVAPDQADEDTAETGKTSEEQRPIEGSAAWVRDLVTFTLLVAGLLVSGLILRQLLLRIRGRLVEERLVLPLEPLPDLHVAREALRRDEQRQWDLLAGSDIRNGIVSCWVVFEEVAAEAGVARRASETASAFVVRLLHALDVDPRPVGELAQLFAEARFSSHPLPEEARVRAEQALRAIHVDLARAGAPT